MSQRPTQQPPSASRYVDDARLLLAGGGYGNLVLWGGWVEYGLRFAQVRRRLVLLAPARLARHFGAGDVACRLLVSGPVGGGRWVSLALGGWVGAVPLSCVAGLTVEFAERHPAAELLDVGESWLLAELGPAEVTIRTAEGCVVLGVDAAASLIGTPDVGVSTTGRRPPPPAVL